VGEASGPSWIRTRVNFSATDEQVGEKVKMPSVASRMYQKKHTTCCNPCLLFEHICTQIAPQYEARKGDPQTCAEEEIRNNKRLQLLLLG
jgi:hypothetical protein